MRVFAIGDLHLPGGDDKPMAVFGSHWEGHFDRVRDAWRRLIDRDDLVLIPGDISWAMQIERALPDLRAIGELPGRKIILRGNHDYWWCGISRLREALPEGMYALQNDAIKIGGLAVCGSRGWTLPDGTDAENERIYARELIRLELSLKQGERLGGRLLVMTHYPPLNEHAGETAASALMERFGVRNVVYGHLHGASLRGAFNGEKNGVRYDCVSCDGIGFCPKLILDEGAPSDEAVGRGEIST